jgi:hypothetical protein
MIKDMNPMFCMGFKLKMAALEALSSDIDKQVLY